MHDVDHDMLVDTLKGHTYKMSRWQYCEAKHHMDPELLQAVACAVGRIIDHSSETNQPYGYSHVFDSVAGVVWDILVSRRWNGNSRNMHLQHDTAAYMLKGFREYVKVSSVKPSAMEATFMFLIYAVHYVLTRMHSIELYDEYD